MFAIYAVSNIAGITNVTDDKFVQVNQNYLTINTAKLSPAFMKNMKSWQVWTTFCQETPMPISSCRWTITTNRQAL